MTERHQPSRRRDPLPFIISALFVAALSLLPGCLGTSTNLRLESILDDAAVAPEFAVRAYVPEDMNTADIYLSDIPTERLLDPDDSLADAVGSIVHIHLFLVPVAGSTPIDATACNATVRQIVLAGPRGPARDRPAIGIYGGGGFLLPDDAPGARSFSGNLFDATLKLTHATPGFADRLGAARMSGDFSVRRDDPLAHGLAQRLAVLLAEAPPVPTAAPPGVAPPESAVQILDESPAAGEGENGRENGADK